MLIDEGLELIREQNALELLPIREVGRVGVTLGALRAIFGVIDGAIIFRTDEGSKLSAAARGRRWPSRSTTTTPTRTGWSVLVEERSEIVHDLDVTFKVLNAGLEPLGGRRRHVIMRIVPELVSGRRVARAG